MSGGVYPGCHPSQAPGYSGAGGHEAGAGDLDPGTSLEQGEWNPLLCFLCHQVRLSCERRGTQLSMISFARLTGSPASSPATTLSVLSASRAGVWMASCHVQSVGESNQEPQSATSLSPQSDLNQTVTEKSPHYETATRSLPRTLFYASWSSLPLTSIPRVLTATEMKRVRCFSAIHVVSDGAGWVGGAAAGTRHNFFRRSSLQFNKGNFKVEINNFGKYVEPILVLLQSR